MEHRYGRHGPRAWLRWRERRYGRPSQLPVPVEPQPTIVRVYVPINAERIIFIIMTDTQNPSAAQGMIEPKVVTDPLAIPERKQDTDETQRLNEQFFNTRWKAEGEARSLARRDHSRRETRSNTDLQEIAKRVWDRTYWKDSEIRDETKIAGQSQGQAAKAFVDRFVEVYDEDIKESGGRILSDIEGELQIRAYDDQRETSAHEEDLSSPNIECLAIIRAYEQTKLVISFDTLARNDYLDIVRGHAHFYQKEYERYHRQEMEADQDDWSSLFR
jgi:hypothetical protein